MCLTAASSCQGSLPLGTTLPTYDLLEVLRTQELHHGHPTSLGPVPPRPDRAKPPGSHGPKGGSRSGTRAPTRAGASELRAIAEIRLPPDGRSWNTIENRKPACAESVRPRLQKGWFPDVSSSTCQRPASPATGRLTGSHGAAEVPDVHPPQDTTVLPPPRSSSLTPRWRGRGVPGHKAALTQGPVPTDWPSATDKGVVGVITPRERGKTRDQNFRPRPSLEGSLRWLSYRQEGCEVLPELRWQELVLTHREQGWSIKRSINLY